MNPELTTGNRPTIAGPTGGGEIMMDRPPRSDFARSAPYWLRRLGVVSWLLLGIVLAAAVVLSAAATFSGIIVPLLVAVVLGIIFRPLVELLARRKVSRSLATALTMILIILGAAGLVWILIQGVIQQGGEIVSQLEAGWISLRAWLLELEIEAAALESIRTAAAEALPALGQGVMGLLGSTFSSLAAFLVGVYFGLFILFFILRDGPELEAWLARQLGLKPETSTGILSDAARSLRLYFRGTAVTAAITATIVVIPLVILNVPLVGSIMIVYFFTSFIPYLGAWVGGAFAVLIAFGAGGVETALIITVAVIISNGAIQSAVSSWALGISLKLHPLVVFLVTIAAGVVGGVLAMILAVPLTAFALQAAGRLRDEGVFNENES